MARTNLSHAQHTIALGVIASAGAASWAQCPLPWWQAGSGVPGIHGEATPFTSVGGEINSAVLWDPDGAGPAPVALVVGGTFSYAGTQRANNIAMWDGSAWQPLGAGTAGPVLALAVAPNNRLIVGGYFAQAGITPANNIAEWDGSNWFAEGDGLNGGVTGIVVRPNGHVIAVGSFDVAGASVVARAIARWDGVDWFAVNQGLRATTTTNDAGSANAIAVMANGDILVGGTFERAAGVTAANIARVRFAANGTTSTWFALGAGTDGYVEDIDVLPSGDVIAGGSFITAGTVAANGIARWNGTTWSSLGTGMDETGVVDITHLANGDIVAAGVFEHIGGNLARGLARWDGSTWSTFAGFDAFHASHYSTGVYTLTNMPDGSLTVGGALKQGVVNLNGATWSHYGSGLDGDVTSIVQLASGDVIAGGTFETVDGLTVHHIARKDAEGWHAMAGGLTFAPTTMLVVAGTDVIAAGMQVPPDGSAATGKVSRWNGTAWSEVSSGFNAFDLAQLPNGDIVAAGFYGGTGGVYRWNGADWVLLGGGSATDGVDGGYVSAVEVLADGTLVVGGTFDAINSMPAMSVAKWDGTTWSAMGVGLGVPGNFEGVTSLTAVAGGVVAAGQFIFDMNAVQYDSIARWDGTAWNTMGLGFPNSYPFSLETAPDGRVIVGGAIDNGAQVWDGTAWTALGGSIEGTVGVIAALQDGNVAIGGNFAFVAGLPSAHYAVFGCPPSACDSIDFNNDTLFPDTADIDDFLSVFSGGPCSTAPIPGCNDIDFNNDTLFPDTMDIDALLSVFSGGPCIL